jgi:hypothetical protein
MGAVSEVKGIVERVRNSSEPVSVEGQQEIRDRGGEAEEHNDWGGSRQRVLLLRAWLSETQGKDDDPRGETSRAVIAWESFHVAIQKPTSSLAVSTDIRLLVEPRKTAEIWKLFHRSGRMRPGRLCGHLQHYRLQSPASSCLEPHSNGQQTSDRWSPTVHRPSSLCLKP